jgi:hypothetical protein
MATKPKTERPPAPTAEAPTSTTTDPLARETERLEQATVSRMRLIAQRQAGLTAVKQRSTERARVRVLARAEALGSASESSTQRQVKILADRSRRYAKQAEQARSALTMAQARERVAEHFGKRAAAFGLVEDASGAPQEGVPVQILVQGKVVAFSSTDKRGSFHLAVPVGVSGDATLEIGDQGKLGTRSLTLEGRPLFPQGVAVRSSHATPKPSNPPRKR